MQGNTMHDAKVDKLVRIGIHDDHGSMVGLKRLPQLEVSIEYRHPETGVLCLR
jgi:hypothetical protein